MKKTSIIALRTSYFVLRVSCFLILFSLSSLSPLFADERPSDFVDITELTPSVVLDIRYATSHNFVGKPISGYYAPKCFLTRRAAEQIAKVQTELEKSSRSLMIYDCYRPTRAVKYFESWAKNLGDTKMKAEFYPDMDKRDLFDEGYVARKSSHSRGSTLDLTIVPIPMPEVDKYKRGETLHDCRLPYDKRFHDGSVDMGTGFDCFDALAHTENTDVSVEGKKNRKFLKKIMEKHGFKNYDGEWWHYTLTDEPYPEKYFDFVVR